MAKPSKSEKLSPLAVKIGSNKFSQLIAKKTNSDVLRNLRKRKGYTLADIAALTGLSPSYISRLEAGDRRYNTDVLSKLSTVLGCTEYDLLKQSDAVAPNTVTETTTYVPQKDLPVYKAVPGALMPNGGNDDYPIGDFENPESRMFRLPQLLGIKTAFALHIVDDINFPKYRKGDIVFVNTEKNLARGCPVVLITLEYQIIIGELIDWDDDIIKLRHFGKTKIIDLDKQTLNASYAIIGLFDYYSN
jgi:transcriptional regulator with XRE-family HTH domain